MILRMLFLLNLLVLPIQQLTAEEEIPKIGLDEETTIQAALEKSSKLKPGLTTLEDLASHLRKNYPFQVVLAADALEAEGIAINTPVEVEAVQVSLRSHLNLSLHPVQLTWLVGNESLMLTTMAEAEASLHSKVYKVTDIVPTDEEGVPDYQALINLVILVENDSWEEVGGPGSVRAINGCLIVNQTFSVHEQIRRLFAGLQILQKAQQETPLAYPEVYPEKVRRGLNKKVELKYQEAPLKSVVEDLARQTKLDFVFQREALEAEGLTPDLRVSIQFDDVSLRSALNLLLRPLQLTWVYRNEVLTITTIAEAETMQDLRLYQVSDLIRPSRWNSHLNQPPIGQLADSIQNTIAPDMWAKTGGPGQITTVSDDILAISVHQDTHQRIERFLSDLRSAVPGEDLNQVVLITRRYDLLPLIIDRYAGHFHGPAWSGAFAGFQQDPDKPAPEAMMEMQRWQADRAHQLAEQLVELLPNEESLQPWEKGTQIQALEGKLLIRQTPEVHAKIGRWLDRFSQFSDYPGLIGYSAPKRPKFEGGGAFSIPPEDAPSAKALAKLNQSTAFEFDNAKLSDALRYFADRHSLKLKFDNEAAFDAETITLEASGLLLYQALDLVVGSNFGWSLKADTLVATTKLNAPHTRWQSYSVPELLDKEKHYPELKKLLTFLEPISWSNVGGVGEIHQGSDGTLLIKQTAKVHYLIHGLLERLAALDSQGKSWGKALSRPVVPASMHVMDRLKQSISVQFLDTPLTDISAYLEDVSNCSIILDREAFQRQGISPEVPLGAVLKNKPIQEVFSALLSPLKMAAVPSGNLILITTKPTQPAHQYRLRLYKVPKSLRGKLDTVSQQIARKIAPESWTSTGGVGFVKQWQDQAFLIYQQPETHEQIAEFLKAQE